MPWPQIGSSAWDQVWPGKMRENGNLDFQLSYSVQYCNHITHEHSRGDGEHISLANDHIWPPGVRGQRSNSCQLALKCLFFCSIKVVLFAKLHIFYAKFKIVLPVIMSSFLSLKWFHNDKYDVTVTLWCHNKHYDVTMHLY